jgi:C-terminal processing protease CtpA/Prc
VAFGGLIERTELQFPAHLVLGCDLSHALFSAFDPYYSKDRFLVQLSRRAALGRFSLGLHPAMIYSMKRTLAVLACAALALVCGAQDRFGLADILSFEREPAGARPAGWSASPPGDIFADESTVHGGKRSVRIERRADSAGRYSTINLAIPMDFAGKAIELRGFVRTENASDFAALWMREDGVSGLLAFDGMQRLHINGTTGWKEYSVSVPWQPDARQLYIGFMLAGTGKAWADDLQLLVDGKPIWEAPKVEGPKTILDTDHDFDNGSKVVIAELSKVQIENLASLGKIWGFLKYHHPEIAAGRRHWDYDLFRILPAVLKAPDREAANAAVTTWIARLGDVPACQSCARLDEAELHLKPEIEWIESEATLGGGLSRALQAVYRNRANDKQFYVSLTPGAGNAVFQNEPAYAAVKLPDPGFQLLALYRFWNIIEYWYPYRDVIGEDWDKVLVEFIPKVFLAKTGDDYKREMLALIARVHDTHANLWTSLDVRPPVGTCQLPVIVRFVENRAVVTGYSYAAAAVGAPLKRGDEIEALDGIAVSDLVRQWKPYYAASNEPTVLRDMARELTRGACGEAKVQVRRENGTLEVAANRVSVAQTANNGDATHDLPGDTFRQLSKDIAYLKLSSVKAADSPKYVGNAAGTKGLVIDIRNYPAEFTVFTLGSLLVDKETPFVRFTEGDLANPGAFHFGPPISLKPAKPHYSGKVVILVDEVAQSSAEYTSMAFRSSPNALVIGSTTAGADGNVSQFPLPGGLRSMISGIGVFYPDKRPTQRVGIVPDLEVKPTIAGIRAGRDELLEAALRKILGPDVPAAEIEKLARAGRD